MRVETAVSIRPRQILGLAASPVASGAANIRHTAVGEHVAAACHEVTVNERSGRA
jgi:hypothetical protein